MCIFYFIIRPSLPIINIQLKIVATFERVIIHNNLNVCGLVTSAVNEFNNLKIIFFFCVSEFGFIFFFLFTKPFFSFLFFFFFPSFRFISFAMHYAPIAQPPINKFIFYTFQKYEKQKKNQLRKTNEK